ncbi:integrase [Burkholderia ubonensis]|uniref:tyrosine-type recombinase/integrase n=1 Tax=Burkholderia ubonensis TaxID=101571 RepID=UPI00075F2CE6|nr:site-specific integrase [Burkholderia ubonensis]KVT96545.1 integrase [Burkholderia ubonensis]
MARLEYIWHDFFNSSLGSDGEIVCEKQMKKPIEKLPQIFWEDGVGWAEANIWALERAASEQIDIETVKRTMKHLVRYASFLEGNGFDWRHFPLRKEAQPLRKFRKHLIDARDAGELKASTTTNCMAAVIQFYRFADSRELVGTDGPLWVDRLAVIPFFDSIGFKRTMTRLSSELSIPIRSRVGSVLEDGLLPLRVDHMTELLRYTSQNEIEELHLMLSVGFFTGARIGTITTVTVSALATAREDSLTPGVFLLPVGPGTGISTKFSVKGEIMVPREVLVDLRRYASSTSRLLREAKSDHKDKGRLFLTRSGKPYTVETVNRLVYEMRERASSNGLKFMQRFRFHQSRATFGTWLMRLLLDSGGRADAIKVVRDAMLHKDEKTTLGYIHFLENTRAKAHFAEEFNRAFTGLRDRNWNKLDA